MPTVSDLRDYLAQFPNDYEVALYSPFPSLTEEGRAPGAPVDEEERVVYLENWFEDVEEDEEDEP